MGAVDLRVPAVSENTARARPATAMVIAEVARDFGLYMKITGGQRIDTRRPRDRRTPVPHYLRRMGTGLPERA